MSDSMYQDKTMRDILIGKQHSQQVVSPIVECPDEKSSSRPMRFDKKGLQILQEAVEKQVIQIMKESMELPSWVDLKEESTTEEHSSSEKQNKKKRLAAPSSELVFPTTSSKKQSLVVDESSAGTSSESEARESDSAENLVDKNRGQQQCYYEFDAEGSAFICRIDPSKPIIATEKPLERPTEWDDFGGYDILAGPGLSDLNVNPAKVVKTLFCSATEQCYIMLLLEFGVLDDEGNFKFTPVTKHEAFAWAEAFFRVPLDDEYASIINGFFKEHHVAEQSRRCNQNLETKERWNRERNNRLKNCIPMPNPFQMQSELLHVDTEPYKPYDLCGRRGQILHRNRLFTDMAERVDVGGVSGHFELCTHKRDFE